jgi:transcriptional regulator with XRE-family HTH domain
MTTHGKNPTIDGLADTRVIRSLLEMSRESRIQLLYALANCTDTVQQTLADLVATADDRHSTEEARARAQAAICQIIRVHGQRGANCKNAVNMEARVIESTPEADQMLMQTGSQEAKFAQTLRELMKAKGITQAELANRSGCTQPAISQMLSRRCRPQKRTIFKLASALSVAATDLWPDLDVLEILDAVHSAQNENEPLSDEEAAAIKRAVDRGATGPTGKPLPKLKR